MPYVKKIGKAKPKRKTVKRVARPRANLIQTIKSVVNRQVETKCSGIDESSFNFATAANNSTLPSWVNLADALNISQGVGDGERVGTVIDVKRAMLNLVIKKDLAVSGSPVILTIFIGYLRDGRGSNPNTQLIYEDGNNSLTWNGTNLRNLRSLNKKLFVNIARYSFKVGQSNLGTTTSNNDFNLYHTKKISLKSMLGKCTFTNDSIAGSHNKDLFLTAQIVQMTDGITTSIPCTLDYFVDVQYKDM